MKKSKFKLYRNIGIEIALLIGVILVGRYLNLISVSPYCKELPTNAVNTVELYKENGCPHWYTEIRSIVKNCYCLIGGIKSCEGDSDYGDIDNGCRGANPPGCPVCPVYKYTPIADYGGLLEGFDCAEDLTITCNDNSKIVTKQCIEGKYVNTDDKCTDTPTPNNLLIIFSIFIIIIGILIIYFARRKKW